MMGEYPKWKVRWLRSIESTWIALPRIQT
jgi:hypothetical protein